MDEILYELRDHSAGLNCGRWDYIFSCIKKLPQRPDFILPDRAQVTMTTPLHARLLAAAHQDLPPPRRARDGRHGGAHPDQERPGANERPWRRCAPTRSARRPTATTAPGWRIPGLVARGDRGLRPRACRSPTRSTASARTCRSTRGGSAGRARRARSPRRACAPTSASACSISRPGCGGIGCVPLYNLMEDAATAEISRAQVWQWIRHPRGVLDDGRKVTVELFREMLREELAQASSDARRGGIRRAGIRSGQRHLRQDHHRRRVRRFPDAARV